MCGALAGLEMVTPNLDQTLMCRLVKPGPKGHWAALCELFEPFKRLHLRVLNDVGCIDALAEPLLHAQFDEAAQLSPHLTEEPVKRRAVARRRQSQQRLDVVHKCVS